SIKTMWLEADTLRARMQSKMRSVVLRSRPQSSALTISAARPVGHGAERFSVSVELVGEFSEATWENWRIAGLRWLDRGVRLHRRPIAGEKALQPCHLLAPAERHQLFRDRPLFTLDHRPEITRAEHRSSEDVWLLRHLIKGSEDLPQR